MNLKPLDKNSKRPAPAREGAAGAVPAGQESSPGQHRPQRKLFQPESKPLDSGVTPLLALRRLRRRSKLLTVLAAACVFSAACPAQDSDTFNGGPPPPDEVTLSNALAFAAEMMRANQPGSTNTAPATNALPASPAAPEARKSSPAETPSRVEPQRESTDRSRNGRSRDRRRDESTAQVQAGPSQGLSKSQTNSGGAKAVEDYASFRMIGERNIFNPNRYAQRPGSSPRPKPKVIDSFGLVGVMSYEKGTFAFFDGSASQFKKALKVSDEIAGYKVAGIGPSGVTLTKDGRDLELRVGSQMRREDQGEWGLSSQPQTYASSAAASPGSSPSPAAASAPAAASGSEDEVLKKLMQRREQE